MNDRHWFFYWLPLRFWLKWSRPYYFSIGLGLFSFGKLRGFDDE